MPAIDQDSCEHAVSLPRQRIRSNGGIYYQRQCQRCFIAVGQPIKTELAIAEVGGIPPAFDKDAEDKIRELWFAEWDSEKAARQQKYADYLKTPEWRTARRLVLKRANGLCEGCLTSPATQVHHLSYAHVYREFLFELVAICDHCHDRWHQDDE